MFLFIPIIPIITGAAGLIAGAVPIIVPLAGTVGGLIVAPAVLKASSNAVLLIKDGKVGLDVQKVVKKISDCDEQIGTIVIDNNLQFDNEMFTKEIDEIKHNTQKIEELKKELEKLNEK